MDIENEGQQQQYNMIQLDFTCKTSILVIKMKKVQQILMRFGSMEHWRIQGAFYPKASNGTWAGP